MLNNEYSFSIDHCGQVDAISEHAAMLIPFYFFPLIILLVIVTRMITLKVKAIVISHIERLVMFWLTHISKTGGNEM